MPKQENTEKARPFSIRLTAAEKDNLSTKAAGQPLGIFIRSLILDKGVRARPVRAAPIRDGEPLGRLLALLGQARLAGNLNQLAKAANTGSLPVTEETERDLRQACADIAEMRSMLLQALGQRNATALTSPSPIEPTPAFAPDHAPTSSNPSEAPPTVYRTPLAMPEIFANAASGFAK